MSQDKDYLVFQISTLLASSEVAVNNIKKLLELDNLLDVQATMTKLKSKTIVE
jgi:hypothetical protein